MTNFAAVILFIITFYATINFIKLFSLSRRIFHFCLGSAALFMAIFSISGFLVPFFPVLDPDFIEDWTTVFTVSFLLSAAAALIRDSKPSFTRFPRFFTFVPMLLIVIYPLIVETVILKLWIISLYQGSTILISLLIYGYKTYVDNEYGYLLVGVIFFLITFILYWLPRSIFSLPEYVWVLLVASGVLIITVGYNQIYGTGKDNLEAERDQDKEVWFI